jgi:hypothetical protein
MILASSAAVKSFSANVVGHIWPSLKPSVARLNFRASWKKQMT